MYSQLDLYYTERMRKNIGSVDRILRLVIALLLFVYAYWKANWIVFALALFVLFESVYGWCIFYQVLGKNTCSIKKR